MSVFKRFNSFIDNKWINSTFRKNDIVSYFEYENNDIVLAQRYLDYYVDAGFVEKSYIVDSIDSHIQYKVVEHIPYSFKLTIKELKKLSDKEYKARYIRKAKLDILEFKTKYIYNNE